MNALATAADNGDMNHPNRGRLVVNLSGPWREHALPMDGWTMLGTVQRGQEVGALAQAADGSYAMVNNRRIQPLNERKVKACLEQAP